jgi:catechol 2,3-dioxygenase-like lactoylglutathione lyase family enzyme
MTIPVRPQISCEQQHCSLPVTNLAEAIEFYTKRLGFQLDFAWGDAPTMAGLSLDCEQIFLETQMGDARGAAVYFVVGNADALEAFHRAAGVGVVVPIADRDYGLRDYRVHDPYGNSLSFGHRL